MKRLAGLIPSRYRKPLLAKTKTGLLLLLGIIALDMTLGTLILKYTDPIKFSQDNPYLVLSVFGIAGLLAYLISRHKKKRHTF